MSPDFSFRLIGLVVFTFLGLRFGADIATPLNLPPDYGAFWAGTVGALFGLIMTPWITVRPVRAIRRSINEWPVERLMMSIIGLLIGLLIALLAAYPLSLLDPPLGTYIPAAIAIVVAWSGGGHDP